MKARLKGAQTGRNLLKKKADALAMRFRQILRKIIEVKHHTYAFILDMFILHFDFVACFYLFIFCFNNIFRFIFLLTLM